jgi:hypothetical protein
MNPEIRSSGKAHCDPVRNGLHLHTCPCVLAGPPSEIRVRKKSDDLQRAGGRIDLPVGEEKFSFFWINPAVGKN